MLLYSWLHAFLHSAPFFSSVMTPVSLTSLISAGERKSLSLWTNIYISYGFYGWPIVWFKLLFSSFKFMIVLPACVSAPPCVGDLEARR